jgi:hypothetical protein
MKRYRLIFSFENAKWMPMMIRTLLKANVRWRTAVRHLTPEQYEMRMAAMFFLQAAQVGLDVEEA